MKRSFFNFIITIIILFKLSLSSNLINSSGVHNIIIEQNGDPFKGIILHGSKKLLDQLDARSHQLINEINNNGKKYIHSVYNYRDMIFVSLISIGTPGQQFRVSMDTASSNLWIVDKTCNSKQKCNSKCKNKEFCYKNCDKYCCGNKYSNISSCDKKTKFDSSKSKTYKNDGRPFSIIYGKGFADGFLGSDILKFGGIEDNNTLIIPNIVFGQSTTIDLHTGKEPIDGTMGLAFQSISINNVEPPLSAAIRLGLLAEAIFTVFLATLNIGQKKLSKGGGQVTYGGYDNKNCGKVIGWTPLINRSYFIFEIEDVIYYNNYSSKTKEKVMSDTASSLIYGNSSIILSIGEQIGAEYNKSQNLLFIPCNKKYNPIIFKINGIKYNLTKDVLTIDIYDPLHSKCLFGMVPQNFPNKTFNWILGAPFIRQYCNIYDIGKNRIGFAKSNNLNND